MRPSVLDPLFAPVSSISGIGPRIAGLIERIVADTGAAKEPRIADLLLTPPHAVIDRRNRPGIAGSAEGAIVTLDLRVDRHMPSPRGKPNVPYRVFCHDDTGEIALTFFHARQSWLEKVLPAGEEIIVSGRMNWFNGRPSMVHPDYISLAEDAGSLPLIEPIYPLTAGLSGKVVAKAMTAALERVPNLAEWLDTAYAKRNSFPSFAGALQRLHRPEQPIDADPKSSSWRRLAYDELLAGQLALRLVRSRVKRPAGRVFAANDNLRGMIANALPYRLTKSQELAISEISDDLSSPTRMLRLLQGDVGAGKTVVALMAMAHVCDAGAQAALMAPTEILARQHFETIEPLAKAAGINVIVLTGREKSREREDRLKAIADGSADIVIGTHALFQEKVVFHDLGLAVIDEQHRFGVHQRLALSAKNTAPDVLVMTATPIPRTLVLAAFGDMEVSRLNEKPAGRVPVTTIAMPTERMDELISRLRHAVKEGQKVYWICPLVEESELVELGSAEDRYKALKPVFGRHAGLVHGRMKPAEKEAAMAAFKTGETRILVATTVVEVGVDVPDATIMVIEHAERFGLAQLHQLRGRVGRGRDASNCILLYKGPLGETAKSRLSIMRETEDGFRIAKEDLKLRGEGDLLGTRQSGMPGFRLARMEFHTDLLAAARDDARLILETDPELISERGKALRLLLYIFAKDEAIRLLRAG
jgi:ATP-dependent DNA helicase RecG